MRIRYIPVMAFLAITTFMNQPIKAETISSCQENMTLSRNNYTPYEVRMRIIDMLYDKYDFDSIEESDYMMSDLGMDSVDMFEFTQDVEAEYGITINYSQVLAYALTYTVYSYAMMVYSYLI